MKNYVKPTLNQVLLDKEICGQICGEGDSWATSTRSGSEWQVCVHYPQTATVNKKTYTFYGSHGYGNNSGTTIKLKVTGHHNIEFLPNPNCTDWSSLPSKITNDFDNTEKAGCGWKSYSTDGNGHCHYFGIVKIDGTVIQSNYRSGSISGVTIDTKDWK